MGTAKLAGVLVCGFAIGAATTWFAQGLTSEKSEKATREGRDAGTAAVPSSSPVVVTVSAPSSGSGESKDVLAAERAARLAAEKERDALRAELAAVKSSVAPFADVAAERAAARLSPFPPEEAARRLQTIGSDVESSLARKDAKSVHELLRELARLGRPAWPLIERIALASFAAAPPPPPATESDDDEKPDVPPPYDPKDDIFELVAVGPLHELAVDAILDGGAHASDFRKMLVMAVTQMQIAATPAEVPFLAPRLAAEPDRDVAMAIVTLLSNANAVDPRAFLEAARAKADPELRQNLSRMALDASNVPDGVVAELARSDDPAIRAQAQLRLIAANPPAPGYMVTSISAGTQAEALGLRPGDIIVGYNGTDVKSRRQLERLKSQVAPDATVRLDVMREGVVQSFSIKPGTLGVNGQAVKPR